MVIEVELEKKNMDTILVFAHPLCEAKLPDGRKIEVIASGTIVRSHVLDKDGKIVGEYDLNLRQILEAIANA